MSKVAGLLTLVLAGAMSGCGGLTGKSSDPPPKTNPPGSLNNVNHIIYMLQENRGFDHYFGIPYSNDMQRKSKETGEQVVPLLRDDKVVELLTDTQQSQVVERHRHHCPHPLA